MATGAGRWLFDLPLPQRLGRIARVVVDVTDGRPSEVVSVHYQTLKKSKGRVD